MKRIVLFFAFQCITFGALVWGNTTLGMDKNAAALQDSDRLVTDCYWLIGPATNPEEKTTYCFTCLDVVGQPIPLSFPTECLIPGTGPVISDDNL